MNIPEGGEDFNYKGEGEFYYFHLFKLLFTNSFQELFVGNVSISSIADKHGTPLYLYSLVYFNF